MKKSSTYILAAILMVCILVLTGVYLFRHSQVQQAHKDAREAIQTEYDRQVQRADELRMLIEQGQ